MDTHAQTHTRPLTDGLSEDVGLIQTQGFDSEHEVLPRKQMQSSSSRPMSWKVPTESVARALTQVVASQRCGLGKLVRADVLRSGSSKAQEATSLRRPSPLSPAKRQSSTVTYCAVAASAVWSYHKRQTRQHSEQRKNDRQ